MKIVLRKVDDWLELRVGETKVLDLYLAAPQLEAGIDLVPYLERASGLALVDDIIRYGV